MKHGILGAGGVGGVIGSILGDAGEEVILIVRPGTANHFPPELSLNSKYGHITARTTVVEALHEPLDVLWIAVKATQLDSALREIPDDTKVSTVVPLLNGVDHVQVLRDRFGHDEVVPATIAGEMERTAPGKYVHPSPFLRMNLAASGRERLARPVEQFKRFGMECNFIDNEQTLLWSKMVFLAPFALSSTAADKPVGGVLSDPSRKKLLEDCIAEACEAARANGAEVHSELPMKLLSSSPPEMRSSMQKDVAAGRAPELDAIAGPILRSAEAHGFHANATQRLVAEIKRRLKT